MTDTVLVTVSPNVAPVINTPGPVSWQVGGPGVAITWVANDTTMGTGTCAVYRNGTVILNATWTSGGNITIVIQGLQPGTYNYTIVVHDGLGCSASSQVIVTVTAAPGDQVPANPIPWITGISIGTTAVLVGIIVVKGYRKP